MIVRLARIALPLVLSAPALGQYCPVGSTYFAGVVVTGCSAGSCWASAPFPGSAAISGSSYPGTHYACPMTAPAPGASENTLYAYDGNGNLAVARDPLARSTSYAYDALGRLTQVVDPAAGTTRYAYDGNGRLRQVTDPRNLATTYAVNGFGETTTLASPDTGVATSTFDAAGNLLTRTDARGAKASYTYDALNRVTRIVYSRSGTTSETHAFTWDGGASPPPHSKGRLTQVSDAAGTTKWTYEAHGRVLTKTQTVGYARTVSYAYDAAGRLASLTTPSGQVIGYTYVNGRVAGITVNGAPLIAGAVTEPFGPLAAWQWGNGLVTLRVYDADGRLSSWEYRNGASVLRNDLAWDRAGRVTANTNPADAALGCAFDYDALDRLTLRRGGSPVGSTQQFGYDAIGNRTSHTLDGNATSYSYAAGSNQLLVLTGAVARTYVYDAAGNPTTVGALAFTYNNSNRLVKVTNGAATVASYKVNALGQRVEKVAGGVTTRFVYDEGGRLLGEYDGTGRLIQETVWLEDLPIATLRPTGATGTPTPINAFYVLADHLGSPRAVVRPADNAIVWRWDNTDPFGANPATENPAGLGTFRYALRFPGQYFDAETGTHYNYFRDYDPPIGRYVQSDPIGLDSGINTYLYVRANPTGKNDRLGLFAYHGNWCGPDWTGGFRREYGQIGPGDDILPPIDALDRCCMVHDICYWKCRCDYGCDESQRRNCMMNCDRTLATCAAAAGAHRGSPLWWWMNYGKPSPGPNAHSCSARR